MPEFVAIKKGNRVGFGSALEEHIGFSRAIRAGDTVYLSGMTATDNRGQIIAHTMYDQMKVIYQKMEAALQAHGASLRDVVKETLYVRDFSDMEGFSRAHKEVFGEILPVITGVTAELVDPEMLVEIEAIAVVGNLG